jgi:hypothetical protein
MSLQFQLLSNTVEFCHPVSLEFKFRIRALQCLEWTMHKVFRPLLDTQDWGKSELLEVKGYPFQAARFNEIFVNASNIMQGGIELRRLEKRFMVENKQQAYIRASQDPEILSVYESVVKSWFWQCETNLVEKLTRKQ